MIDESDRLQRCEQVEAWLLNADRAEQLRWRGLPEGRRRLAYRRLEALLGHLNDGDTLPAVDAAVAAGVTLRRFYQIARAWESRPGIDAIGVRSSAPAKRATTLRDHPNREARERAIAAMRAILREDPDARTEAALREVREKAGPLPSRNSLLRWWKVEQRAVAAGRLGQRIALDYADLDIAGLDGRPLGVAFVIDLGARLPLGAALYDGRRAYSGYREAVTDALDRIEDLPYKRGTTLRRVDVWVPGLNPQIEGAMARSLTGLPVRYSHDPAAKGRSVSAATDGRLGPLRLRFGAVTATTDKDELRRLEPTDVEDLIRAAMDERHREFVAAVAVRSDAAPEPGGGVARVEEVLRRIAF